MKQIAPRWWLLPYYIILYILPIGAGPLLIPDEARYAEISREMLASGNWIVPRFLGLRYFEKPVGGYWFNNIFHWLLGESEFSARAGVAIATGITALLVYFFTRRVLASERKAVWATFGYLSCLEVILLGTHATLDPMLTLWLAAAWVSWWFAFQVETAGRKLLVYGIFGAMCGLAFLTKGFVALAIPVVAIVPFMLLEGRIRELVVYGFWSIIVAALVATPWALAIYHREPDYWHYFFWVENIKRFSSSHAQHREAFWFYLPVLFVGCLPWTGLIPGAMREAWRDQQSRSVVKYLTLWVVMPLLLLSIAHGKLPTYVLPLFSPLAILVALGLERQFSRDRLTNIKANAVLNLVVGGLGLITVFVMKWHPHHGKLYYVGQTAAWLSLLAIFGLWCAAAAINLMRPRRMLPLLLVALAGTSLLLPYAIPQRVLNAKFPDSVLQQNRKLLNNAVAIGVNDVGVAASVAWVARRDDLTMLAGHGELRYGLAYPDASNRWIAADHIDTWTRQMRQSGKVVIVWRQGSYGSELELPPADKLLRHGRLEIRIYNRRP